MNRYLAFVNCLAFVLTSQYQRADQQYVPEQITIKELTLELVPGYQG